MNPSFLTSQNLEEPASSCRLDVMEDTLSKKSAFSAGLNGTFAKSLAESLAGIMALGALIFASFSGRALLAQGQTLIEVGDEWRYFKGTVAPPATWTNAGFDDNDGTVWLRGPTGIGYGDNAALVQDDATVLADMQNGYMAFFARRAFTILDLPSVSRLVLSIDYDDGFVAYLNGAEVVRAGLGAVGTPVAFDQAATTHEAGTVEFFDIPIQGLLQGPNVLAVEVHNTAIASTDASFIPRLIANGNFPPTALTCALSAVNPGTVDLAWTNNSPYDSIRVERNAATIANLAGNAVTFTDPSPTPLDNNYVVVAKVAGTDYRTNNCAVNCTQSTLTCALSLVGGVTQAALSWTSIPDGVSAQIFREGAAMATLTNGETSFFDPNVESAEPESDTDYRVVLTNGSGQTCTLTCVSSLCPENFTAKVVNGRVELTWDNLVRAWDHFEISRDGTVIDAAVPATQASWTDPNVILSVGASFDYLLHPVAVSGGEFPPPMTQCDKAFILGYTPEIGKYDPPAGGWDYVLKLSTAGPVEYNPNVGETGNLDGRWIRAIDRDFWDGSAPEGGPPAAGAPGGIDVVTRPGVGPCGSGDINVLRIQDPGDPNFPIGTAFPDPFPEPNNSRIFLGLDLGATDRNLLKSGITFNARLRTSPNAPAYMNANPASGDGAPLHLGTGHVGVYYRAPGTLPAEGATASAAFALQSGNNGGDVQFSANPMTDIDAAGIKSFMNLWMTVRGGASLDTYDVNIYLNGSTTPANEVSGQGVALQAGTADFGPDVINFLAIGSNSTVDDLEIEVDYVAYKIGVFPPSAISCGPGGGGPRFHRGDSDDNGQLQLTDAVRILGFLFLGGQSPTCLDAADSDDNGQLQLTDAVRILGFLFLGGAAPAPPGPPASPCGEDPGTVHIGCARYTHC
jgi:hypothetical protein